MSAATQTSHTVLTATVHRGSLAEADRSEWAALRRRCGASSPSYRHEWLAILHEGLGHEPFCIEVRRSGSTAGVLPLCFLNTRLFGRFLVGRPYLNVGGVLAEDDAAATELIDQAVRLADELDVRYLELRHEQRHAHSALAFESVQKVHMRLPLPADADELWSRFKPKVRNQIRKAEQNGLTVAWGGDDLLDEFYRVFAINMRDLGTPVFGRRLFASVLARLGDDAEICVVRRQGKPCAAGLLIHGDGLSETPSASSLRQFNHLSGNMLLYWSFLKRCIERRQRVFDFGRTTIGSNTHRFKAQWGAEPHPAIWQYYVRRGSVDDMRPDNPKQQRRIAVWKRLPVWITRLAGPRIVRGIP
jgi:FemAB-related protein (PEP-CTERM system-associated)